MLYKNKRGQLFKLKKVVLLGEPCGTEFEPIFKIFAVNLQIF